MQHIHECNGPGLIDYPEDVKVTDVNVYRHDSGMFMTHDYSCPVCRENHAVIDGSTGLMQPCWSCQNDGYKLIKKDTRKWFQKIFS